uniref:Uncharacterized protein n=1 Tax=Plectus sambesii TaxID=2011161 RepID=A0A914X5H4_9BILA
MIGRGGYFNFDGDILPTVKFDLAKKAVLVTAAQLTDIDQQEVVKGARSIEVDMDTHILSTTLENFAAAISNTTYTSITSILTSCSNVLAENETSFEACDENFCFGMYCFAVLDNDEKLKYFTGCINVTDNVKIVEFVDDYNSVCRYNGSYSECICIYDKCNSPMMSLMVSYSDGDILSTIQFDLAKKAVLVTAAHLANIDEHKVIDGVTSTASTTDANVPSTPLENLIGAVSNTTHSNATSIPVSASISTTALAVTKNSNSISSSDYGMMAALVMMLLAQIFLTVNIE